jgi:hypothetical protein
VSEREQSNGTLEIHLVEPGQVNAVPEIAFEAFGVPVVVNSNQHEVLDRVRPILPPGWRPCASEAAETWFTILADASGTYGIAKHAKPIARGLDLDLALEVLDSQFRVYVGEKSPDAIFVHAGVVAHRGRAIVLPGVSFVGKTTLVAALVRAGATYYSDEFALIDERGLVHPYAKPLSIRGDDYRQTDHAVDHFGGVAGDEPLPVGAIIVTSYRPGAEWQPRRLSPGEAAMALLSNAVPARERPKEVVRAVSRAADGAIAIESFRAEAATVAPLLLAELETQPA